MVLDTYLLVEAYAQKEIECGASCFFFSLFKSALTLFCIICACAFFQHSYFGVA